jgi:type IV secretion system protein VirB8
LVFKYSGAPMTEKDRAVNPLGFQVTEYRNDPDSSVTSDSTPAAPANAQPTADPLAPTINPGLPPPQAQVPAIAPATATNQ